MNRVIGMKRNAIERDAIGVLVFLDLNTIRVVRSDLMQGDDVGCNQPYQDQGNRNHVKGKEPVQCGITHHKISANPDR